MESMMPQWKRDLIQRRRQQQQQQHPGKPRTPAASPESAGGAATRAEGARADSAGLARAVARNMRLEADCLSLCSEADDVANGSASCELEECPRMPESRCFEPGIKAKEDVDSDSSEELHYGPGIVNKLKSKYLNLTLRESNKRGVEAPSRFRRAASLEDLLDRNEEKPVNEGRKYAKRNGNAPWQIGSNVVASNPTERYRNAARGHDSMKRARSVETLLRCDANDRVTARMVMVERDEPVNERVVLVDRSSVKIESRLGEERLRALNKPKRLKPVLAETERPPPDLVKTTMRIFESGAARRLKPKGEVAAKVATFKTINDSMKAQSNPRKIIAKNGGPGKFTRRAAPLVPTSPKKLQTPVQNPEAVEVSDGVVTEPIARSVSSVVSKFRQFEQARSPAQSPTSDFKLKLSPAPSPEPRTKGQEVKSPICSPVTSPKNISPASSPVKSSPTLNNKLVSPTVEPVVDLEPEKRLAEASSEDVAQVVDRRKLEDSPEKMRCEDRTDQVADFPRAISKAALDNISKAGTTMQFSFDDKPDSKSYLPGATRNGQRSLLLSSSESNDGSESGDSCDSSERLQVQLEDKPEESSPKDREQEKDELAALFIDTGRPAGTTVSGLGLLKSGTTTTSFPQGNESKTIRCQKSESNVSPPQKQIGIIRPLVSTKTQLPQQNLSNRELEKNLINRVKSIEQPTKVVVSLKSAEEIQPVKKPGPAGGGLWDTKPWNQQNNTMVFNFSNRKDVPDYIENDGLIIRRRRDKGKVGDSGIIVLDNSLDSSNSEESEWEISAGPPSPCDVAFFNDNVLINGRSNLSRQPRNHKHRIQFDDSATRTFEYPSEASMLEGEGTSVDGETCCSGEQFTTNGSRAPSASATSLTSVLTGSGLGNYTPSKVDLASEGFELGVTRAVSTPKDDKSGESRPHEDGLAEVDYAKPAQDAGAWGSETTVDLLF